MHRFSTSATALMTLAGSVARVSASLPFNAIFASTPTPFQIQVDPGFIADIRNRVANTRYVADDLGIPAFEEGPSVSNATTIGNHWTSSYNWTQQQESINRNLKQYTITIQTTDSNYTEPVPLHYVHHTSPRPDATPLLFIHGFPGSFLEVSRIITNLTHPPNPALPAFHVVAPSIPGFAFSPGPSAPGFGPIEASHTFDALMKQLGYPRYVIQGGDLGAGILRLQSFYHSDSVISALSNFWIQPPNATDIARHTQNLTTPEENAYFATLDHFAKSLAHFYVQQVAPLQVAYGLTDSPLGFAMWIYQLLGTSGPDDRWSLDEIVTFAMMYVIQGPYQAMRFYREHTREGVFAYTGFGDFPYVNVPVGVTKRKYDFPFNLPLSWAQRRGNITAWIVHEDGGHFAAYQSPDTLLDDIWSFFANVSAYASSRAAPRAMNGGSLSELAAEKS